MSFYPNYVQTIFLLIIFPAFDTDTTIEDLEKMNFCSPQLRCDWEENTACKCTTSEGCKYNDESEHEFRQAMLHIHNDYRNLLANGSAEIKDYMKEGAANMQALNYDLGLEYLCKCHVTKCTIESDKCRKIRYFESIGQNVDQTEWAYSTVFKDSKTVKNWFMDGARLVPKETIDSYQKSEGK